MTIKTELKAESVSVFQDARYVGVVGSQEAAQALVRQDAGVNGPGVYEAVTRALYEAMGEQRGQDFRGFTEIPELAFVEGSPQTEHLSLFLTDLANLRTPGDWQCGTAWRSAFPVALECEMDAPLPSCFTYDDRTMTLRYDGTALGDGRTTLNVHAHLSAFDRVSPMFRIRVLRPTNVWGQNAQAVVKEKGWSGAVAHEALEQSFAEARKQFVNGKTDDAPRVVVITRGHYAQQDWFLGKSPYMYVFGLPEAMPTLEDDVLSSSEYRVRYIKNLHLVSVGLQGTALVDVCSAGENSDDHITNVTFRDEKRYGTAISTPSYEDEHGGGKLRDVFPTTSRWRTFAWNMYSSNMGSPDGTQHMFYVQGRPNTQTIINNIRIDGTRRCDCVKSTRSQVFVRNSHLSAVQDETDLSKGFRAAVCIDIPACTPIGPSVVFNNTLVGAGSGARGGIKPALLYIRSRRDWKAADDPHYPDRSWDPPTCWSAGYNRGPEVFVDPAYWDVVKAKAITDPDNAEAFQHHVSFNTFRWIDENGEYMQTSAYRNEGTHPREALSQFSPGSNFLRVPEGWVDRSCGHFYGNKFEGFGGRELIVVDESEMVAGVEEGAKWPRVAPSEFPQVVMHEGERAPEWMLF